MVWEFDKELYHNRNLVETMLSVLKRKYGEYVKAKSTGIEQRKLNSKY
jgi:hypothetical protein